MRVVFTRFLTLKREDTLARVFRLNGSDRSGSHRVVKTFH